MSSQAWQDTLSYLTLGNKWVGLQFSGSVLN